MTVIIKSLSRRNNTLQLVDYLFKQRVDEKVLPVLKHNLRSNSIKGWAKEFEQNETLRINKRSNAIKLTHNILSFSNKDKKSITLDLLKDISKKFVELRGQDNLYLATCHTDKDHIHLHIILSGSKYLTGESNRISKAEFQELKLALDQYQKEKYPQLVNSLPEHGKSRNGQQKVKNGKSLDGQPVVSNRQEILSKTEAIYKSSKSLDDFLSQLKSLGFEPYYRGGNLYGLGNEQGQHFKFKTMGFDQDRLRDLDQRRSGKENELQEIRDLRDSKSSEKSQESHKVVSDKSENSIDPEYDGLGI